MNRKRIVAIVVVFSSLLLMILIVFLINNQRKNEIGNYDIYTLVILEHEMDHFVEQYESGELDDYSLDLFHERVLLLIEYLRRSPTLKFMNDPLQKLADYETEGIDDEDIEWIRQVQQEIREITIELHNKSGDNNIGLLTYRYFSNKGETENLRELLNRE